MKANLTNIGLLKKICEQAYSKYRENLISAIRNKEVEYHSLKVQIGDGISEDVLFAKEPKHEALEDDMRERGHIKGAEINLNSDRYRVSADDSKPDSPSSTSPPLSAEVSNSALGRKPSKLSRRFREQAPDTNEGPDVPSTTKRARKEDSTDNQSIVPRLGRPRKKARRFEAQESESNEEVDSTPTPTTSVASIPAESMSKKLIQQLIPALENIIQHKHGAIFTQPISARDAPNYDSFVYKPQDFRTLKNQLKNGEIQNTAEFYREILRIFANAIMYNREGSAVAQWAGSCFYFTEEILKDYRALEWLSTSSSEALGDKHHPGIKRKKY